MGKLGYGMWDMGYGIWVLGIWDMGYGMWDMGVWMDQPGLKWASWGWPGRYDISLLKLWYLKAYTPEGLGARLAKCTGSGNAECSVRAYTPTPPPSEPPDASSFPWPCGSMTYGTTLHALSCSLYVLILQCILTTVHAHSP